MLSAATSSWSRGSGSRFDLWAHHLAAFCSGCILLVGRWSFDRLDSQGLAFIGAPSLRGIGITVLALLALYFAAKKPKVSRNSYIISLVAFLCWMALTALWSSRPEAAAHKLVDVTLLGIFLAAFHQLAIRIGTDRFLTLFTRYVFLLLGLLAAAAALSLSLADSAAVGRKSGQVFVLGSGPNVFGRNMALLTCFLLIQMRRGWLMPMSIGFAGVSTLLLLLSGSRSAVLGLAIGLLLTLVFLKRSVWLRVAIPLLLLIPTASTSAYQNLMESFGYSTSHHSVWSRVVEVQADSLVNHTFKNFHDAGRAELYEGAFQMGVDSPIGGEGLGGYQLHGSSKTFHYPHNLVAEAWAEGGGIGVILLLVIGIRFAWRFLPTIRSTWGPLSVGVLLSGIFSMLSGDIYDSRVLMCFALAWMLKHDSIPVRSEARTSS